MHLRMKSRKSPPKPTERMKELIDWLHVHKPLLLSQLPLMTDAMFVHRMNQETGLQIRAGKMLPDDAAYHWLKALKQQLADAQLSKP